ncbi:MAG: glycoside hydrolase family 127 protein, partial [Lachnospiraceae bacterium]|nr:glycoside hydrolase family 127 protein [Lachnospiraceae bacterium]
MLRILNEKEVTVLPGLFAGRMKLNAAYLRELDPKMLLQNYYLEAGEIMDGLQVVEDPSKAPLHWGWEAPTCQLRGHFLGHYLSAAAAIVAGPGDTILSARIDHIVRELGRLQKLNATGWVAPIPEKYFTILMTDRYIWSPQYTMHKLLMGLTDVWELLGNAEALTILSGLADWYLAWVKKATEHATATGRESAVFAGEQAGMLEIWARLYAGTEDLRYRKLAEHYEGNSLFDVLDQGGDPLTDNHANASIPLAHGAACMYEITGEEKWKDRVLAFWEQAVTRRGMLATSGANAGEFWIPPQREGE